MKRVSLIGGAFLALLLFAGCGSADDGGGAATGTVKQLAGKPIKGPKPKETIDQAKRRIVRTIASGDCEQINKLNPISRPDYRTPEKCEEFKALARAGPSAAAVYSGGAVIEYPVKGRTLRAVLVVDSDGYYSIALVDRTHTGPSIGTKLSPEFDQVARQVVDAFRNTDCDAYTQLALRRYGVGSTGSCSFLENPQNPLSSVIDSYADARAKPLGGNRDYAFYGVASPAAFVTMILARESDSDVAAGTPPLPGDAPEYGFVNAFTATPGGGAG